ncbi:MAG TPA: hypothetical protein VHD83_22265 [Puia sp.]|nr:hypothetical protein [Puia sp.]
MTREELIELVKKIQTVEGYTEEQIHDMVRLFIANVPDPNAYGDIFHSDLSPEEIVDKALSYKPIQL